MRGMLRFSIENLLSDTSKKLRRGTLLCFTNFWYRKKLWIRGGGGGGGRGRDYYDFLSKMFIFSHSFGRFRKGTLPCCVSQISSIEKFY